MLLHVESLPGLHGDPEPVAFYLGESRLEVVQILDRWMAKDHNYFKLQASDGALYILRHSVAPPEWNLTLYRAYPDSA